MDPAISTADLMKIPFLPPSQKYAKRITEIIKASRKAREEAHRLLTEANRMVEEMILAPSGCVKISVSDSHADGAQG